MSETVKLIIEIPKATYEDLKSGKIYSSLCEAPQGLIEGIRNGTPLKDVKAEIIALRYGSDTYKNAIDDVIEILDNIEKGE